jgi:hypothetical protein
VLELDRQILVFKMLAFKSHGDDAMRVGQWSWSEAAGWRGDMPDDASLVLYFGSRPMLECATHYHALRQRFPQAHILGCSSGGQINNDEVGDEEIAGAAVRFDRTPLRLASAEVRSTDHSRTCGKEIGRTLAADDLAGIFVLSDGLNVNGSQLVAGITDAVGRDVSLTGGLAGDGGRFAETLVGADGPPRKHMVAAVGFYGPAIRFGHGSAGGWAEFGPRRRITRSRGDLLYELDGEPALNLYERYLGEEDIKGLPGSALLFPLRIYDPDHPKHDIVRTVLAIDRETRTMTFAGDMPEGWTAQLMRGDADRLVAGAATAARQARERLGDGRSSAELAVLVSCIGRRLLMGQNTADEVEAAGAEIGTTVPRLGFYSYGEIAPHGTSGMCELHNQTMTITTMSEAAG